MDHLFYFHLCLQSHLSLTMISAIFQYLQILTSTLTSEMSPQQGKVEGSILLSKLFSLKKKNDQGNLTRIASLKNK